MRRGTFVDGGILSIPTHPTPPLIFDDRLVRQHGHGLSIRPTSSRLLAVRLLAETRKTAFQIMSQIHCLSIRLDNLACDCVDQPHTILRALDFT
jgi:hypothetical protein